MLTNDNATATATATATAADVERVTSSGPRPNPVQFIVVEGQCTTGTKPGHTKINLAIADVLDIGHTATTGSHDTLQVNIGRLDQRRITGDKRTRFNLYSSGGNQLHIAAAAISARLYAAKIACRNRRITREVVLTDDDITIKCIEHDALSRLQILPVRQEGDREPDVFITLNIVKPSGIAVEESTQSLQSAKIPVYGQDVGIRNAEGRGIEERQRDITGTSGITGSNEIGVSRDINSDGGGSRTNSSRRIQAHRLVKIGAASTCSFQRTRWICLNNGTTGCGQENRRALSSIDMNRSILQNITDSGCCFQGTNKRPCALKDGTCIQMDAVGSNNSQITGRALMGLDGTRYIDHAACGFDKNLGLTERSTTNH